MNDNPAEVRPLIAISVCITCKQALPDGDGFAKPGEDLLATLRAALTNRDSAIELRPVACMSVCKRPLTASISGEGRYTYVFGDLQADASAEALIDCAEKALADPFGYVPWAERQRPLQTGIVARIPPPGWSPPDGKPPR